MDPRLEPVARDPLRAGIFCDFDGALSPIVPDPEAARPVDGAEGVLVALAARFRVVAVVSGRSVESLRARLRVPGVMLVGLHGIERSSDGRIEVIPEAEAARPAVDRALARLRERLAGVDCVIEPKGYALAVHFRRARDPVASAQAAEEAILTVAREEGLLVEPGRRIFEVRPVVRMDKGIAVRRLIAETGIEAALVAGDDTGDRPAFDAAGELPRAVRVAVASPEAPRALLDAADLRVSSPRELVDLLRSLL